MVPGLSTAALGNNYSDASHLNALSIPQKCFIPSAVSYSTTWMFSLLQNLWDYITCSFFTEPLSLVHKAHIHFLEWPWRGDEAALLLALQSSREESAQSQFTPKWPKNNIKLTSLPLTWSIKPRSHSDNNRFSQPASLLTPIPAKLNSKTSCFSLLSSVLGPNVLLMLCLCCLGSCFPSIKHSQ